MSFEAHKVSVVGQTDQKVFVLNLLISSTKKHTPINHMFYVYLIQSIPFPDKHYVGYTIDLQERLLKHNEGGSIYTKDHKPWKLVMYFAFVNRDRALAFEKYLKSGSGNAFAKKRFWN